MKKQEKHHNYSANRNNIIPHRIENISKNRSPDRCERDDGGQCDQSRDQSILDKPLPCILFSPFINQFATSIPIE